MFTKAHFDRELKILGADSPDGAANGLIRGYAAHFNSWDRVQEMIMPGAHTPHLGAFLKDGFVAWGHDWAQPIATPVQAYEDGTGLYVVSEFHSTPSAQEKRLIAKERLDRGLTMGQSIGYQVLKDEYVTRADGTRGRKLLDVPIHEYSLVTVPANPQAQTVSIKGGLPLDLHADAALAVVADYVARVRALADLRAKDGRVLSAANRSRLATLHQSLADCHGMLGDLLAATDPAAKSADPAAVRAALAAALIAQAAWKDLA